jgi:hypothetical protein
VNDERNRAGRHRERTSAQIESAGEILRLRAQEELVLRLGKEPQRHLDDHAERPVRAAIQAMQIEASDVS